MTALHTLKRGLPLAINGIHKAFGEREVLKNVQLNIPAGQFVAVVGRSGCGKSTLLRLLAGLDVPTQGNLHAGNAPLAASREDIRLMFQDSRLLPWKRVIDNVGLGLSGNWRPQAQQALELSVQELQQSQHGAHIELAALQQQYQQFHPSDETENNNRTISRVARIIIIYYYTRILYYSQNSSMDTNFSQGYLQPCMLLDSTISNHCSCTVFYFIRTHTSIGMVQVK